ncbi:MAG TPA: MraY family glycosyltransferase [Actinomycetota bacterium]|nr:MraY family glycosyltransferase [Actinomycetota bacterium]
MQPYLVVFAVSAGVTFVATPLVRRLSLRLGWIDQPSDRKVHPKPTPTVGGLAIFVGVVAALGVTHVLPSLTTLHETTSELDAALVAGAVIVLVGLVDDTRGLSPLGKLAGQVLAAGLLVLAGVQLLYFYFPGQGVLSLSPDLAVPVTVVWIAAMVNAVNLIDGLDGLAAGMVAIGAIAFFVYMAFGPTASEDPSSATVLSVVVAGAAIGFLPWNFYPAKIFMGDTGSGLLGLMLAVATISGVGRNPLGPSGGDLAAIAIPVILPLLVLAIPFLDVVLAVVRRMRKGLGVHHADKEHIHHRLMDIGHSQRQAVLLMYLWSALISGCALAVAFIDGRLLVIGIVTAAVLFAVVLPKLLRDRNPRGSDLAAGDQVAREGASTIQIPEAEGGSSGASHPPVEPETPRGAAAR